MDNFCDILLNSHKIQAIRFIWGAALMDQVINKDNIKMIEDFFLHKKPTFLD